MSLVWALQRETASPLIVTGKVFRESCIILTTALVDDTVL